MPDTKNVRIPIRFSLKLKIAASLIRRPMIINIKIRYR